MGFNTIESLESRRMLSAVAAHVVGTTLKVTGTPRNDSIIVSLKGQTLTVKANNIARNFPAKGVKLIDLRGGGGKDKLQVTAPIAYKLNGGKTVTPRIASLRPVPTIPTPTLPQASSGTLTIDQPTTGTTTTAGLVDNSGGTSVQGGCIISNTPVQGTLQLGSGAVTFSGGTLNLSGGSNTYTGAVTTSANQAVFIPNPGSTATIGATLNKIGSGTLTLGGSSFTTGGTRLFVGGSLITGGTLTLGGNPIITGETLTLFNNSALLLLQPLSIPANSSVVIAGPCGELHLVLQALAAGQTPQVTFSSDETVWNGAAISLTVAPTAVILPGTYPLVRFADTAWLPADIGQTTFRSEPLPPQYAYTLTLNATNRTIDLVIADKLPVEPTAADEPTAEPLATDQSA